MAIPPGTGLTGRCSEAGESGLMSGSDRQAPYRDSLSKADIAAIWKEPMPAVDRMGTFRMRRKIANEPIIH